MPMVGDHNALVRSLFDAAMDLVPSDRLRFVEERTPDQPSVRAEVLELLGAGENSSFLDEPMRSPVSHDPALGRQVGRYRLLREIGRGGMGVVYLAARNDDVFHKVVALKIIGASGDREFVERFKKERQILAGLDHPNIARILDGGDTEDGRPFYVMEYVPGAPIDLHCKKVNAQPDARVRLGIQICEAVDYLHEHAIVHRDLKAGNILVTPEGQVKLLDFGIARVQTVGGLLGAEAPDQRTMLLTPGYASPEQVRGDPVTKKSDVYSVGAVLYELLTGRLPHTHSDGRPDLGRQLSGIEPVAPSRVAAGDGATRRTASTARRFTADLDTVVLTALKCDPSRRYPTVRLLAEELTRALEGRPLQARGGSWPYALGHFLGRHRAVASLAVLVVLALGMAGGFAVRSHLDRTRVQATEAEMERLVSVLNVRVERWASPGLVQSAEKVADVESASRIIESKTLGELIAAGGRSERVRAVVGGIRRFLDRADQLSTDQPALRKTLAVTYRRVGDFEATAPGVAAPAARLEAVASYRRAATIASSVVSVDRAWAESQLKELAERVNRFGASLGTLATAADNGPPNPARSAPVSRTNATARAAERPLRRTGVPTTGLEPAGVAEPVERLALLTKQVADARNNVESLRARLTIQGQVLRQDIDVAMAQAEGMLDEARTAANSGDVGGLEDALRRLTYTLHRVGEAVGR